MSNASDVVSAQRRDWDALWMIHGGSLLRRVPSVEVLGVGFGGRMIYVSVPMGCDLEDMYHLHDRSVRAGLCLAFPEFVIEAGGFDVNGPRGDAWRDWSGGLLRASGAVLVPDVPGVMTSATVWCDVLHAVGHNMPVFVLGDA